MLIQAAFPSFDLPPVVIIDHSFIPPHVVPVLASARRLGLSATKREKILVASWTIWRLRGSIPSDAVLGGMVGCSTHDAERHADGLATETDAEGRPASLWPVPREIETCPPEDSILSAIAAARRAKVDALMESKAKVRRRAGRLQMRERRGAVVMVRRGEVVEA